MSLSEEIEPTTPTIATTRSSKAAGKTPPRARRARAVSPIKAKSAVLSSAKKSNIASSSNISNSAAPTTPTGFEDKNDSTKTRVATLERELDRVKQRADARRKEADGLRKRVQELEPQVRRLEKDLENTKRRAVDARSPLLRSPRGGSHQPSGGATTPSRSPTTTFIVEDDVALRGRVEAAEKRTKVLQLRCDQLELERGLVVPSSPYSAVQNDVEVKANGTPNALKKGMVASTRGPTVDTTEKGGAQEAKRIKRQLEVAERRVKNSLYINEAHENLAVEASAREMAANVRAEEFERQLMRTLEKLESIERRDMINALGASVVRDEEGIHLTERELRAHQLDPELHLPVNTAKRRQLARSEQRLHRLRLRRESQSAALLQAQSVERMHSDLRTAAGSGDVEATVKLLESGISVNVPDETGLSAFLYSCGQGQENLVRAMLEAGGDVLDGKGSITGLIIAARKGEVGVVKALLEAGADVAGRDSAGGTALHAAALRGHMDASRVLLEAGSDCNAVDQGTNTPLHMLTASHMTREGNHKASGRPESAELASLLLEWGASADIKNSEGLTPVSAALNTRNRALVLAYRAFFGEEDDAKVLATAFASARGVARIKNDDTREK